MPSNLNEKETLLFLPAPLDTRRDLRIMWYEAQVSPPKKAASVIACNAQAEEVGLLETQKVGKFEITTIISEGRTHVTIKLALSKMSSGGTDRRVY